MQSTKPATRSGTDRYERILQQVCDAVIVTDLEGVVTLWNASAERIYGYPAEEAIGRHISLLYFDEDLPTFGREVMGRLKSEGSSEIALARKRRKDGREVITALRLSLLRDESGEPIGMIG